MTEGYKRLTSSDLACDGDDGERRLGLGLCTAMWREGGLGCGGGLQGGSCRAAGGLVALGGSSRSRRVASTSTSRERTGGSATAAGRRTVHGGFGLRRVDLVARRAGRRKEAPA